MSLLYVLLGTALLAAVMIKARRDSGNKGAERRKPGLQPAPALLERRKDDEVGGES